MGGAAAYEAFAAVCGGVSFFGKAGVMHAPWPVCTSRSLLDVVEGFSVAFIFLDMLRWSGAAADWSSGKFKLPLGMPRVGKPEVSDFFELWWDRHFGSRWVF